MNHELPFERGETYFQGDSSRLTTTGTDRMLGMRFVVRENYDNAVNGSSLENEKELVIVRNGSSGSIYQGRAIRFNTGTAKTKHRICKGYVAAVGDYGLAIDDAYSSTYEIKPNDLFYAVLTGPNKSLPAADTASARMRGGVAVRWDANGRVEPATSNSFVTGQADANNTNTNTSTRVIVHHFSASVY